MQRQAVKNFQSATGGSVVDGKAPYEASKSNPNDMAALERQVLEHKMSSLPSIQKKQTTNV